MIDYIFGFLVILGKLFFFFLKKKVFKEFYQHVIQQS